MNAVPAQDKIDGMLLYLECEAAWEQVRIEQRTAINRALCGPWNPCYFLGLLSISVGLSLGIIWFGIWIWRLAYAV